MSLDLIRSEAIRSKKGPVQTGGFGSEAELIKVFLRKMSNGSELENYTKRMWRYLKEIDCGYAIADLVFAKISRESLSLRRQSDLMHPVTDSALSRVLSSMPRGKPLYTSTLSERTGYVDRRVRGLLRGLISTGYVEVLPTSSYRRHRDSIPVAERIVAVEAKRTDWNQALRQAGRYFSFAHYVYVLFDASRIARVLERRAEFERLGIGILSITPDEDLYLHSLPKQKGPRSKELFFRVSEAFLREETD